MSHDGFSGRTESKISQIQNQTQTEMRSRHRIVQQKSYKFLAHPQQTAELSNMIPSKLKLPLLCAQDDAEYFIGKQEKFHERNGKDRRNL